MEEKDIQNRSLEIRMTRPGSPEKGERLPSIAILLNSLECPPLASTRDLLDTDFSNFMIKEKSKNREEQRASGAKAGA